MKCQMVLKSASSGNQHSNLFPLIAAVTRTFEKKTISNFRGFLNRMLLHKLLSRNINSSDLTMTHASKKSKAKTGKFIIIQR